jgi:hypothetical protein
MSSNSTQHASSLIYIVYYDKNEYCESIHSLWSLFGGIFQNMWSIGSPNNKYIYIDGYHEYMLHIWDEYVRISMY